MTASASTPVSLRIGPRKANLKIMELIAERLATIGARQCSRSEATP